jgi:hypothetical protein
MKQTIGTQSRNGKTQLKNEKLTKEYSADVKNVFPFTTRYKITAVIIFPLSGV